MCACERVKGLTSHSWSIGSFAFVGYGTRYNRCTQGRFMDGAGQKRAKVEHGQVSTGICFWNLSLLLLLLFFLLRR